MPSRMFAMGSRLATALIAAATLFVASVSHAAVYVSVSIAPPLLPVYAQPLIPGPGYIWTPGYWAWGPDGFYWVPGTWVLAPFVGALWTPGYWGWRDGLYWWHPGYWGRHVGYYGGIDYGYGYTGSGYAGGYWNRGVFTYNRTVNNINVTNIHNYYNTTVARNTSATRVSYNGGPNGVVAGPTPQDRIAEREAHTPLLAAQARHELAANSNRALLASVNGGNPSLAATTRPQAFAAARQAPARSFSQQPIAKPSAGAPQPRAELHSQQAMRAPPPQQAMRAPPQQAMRAPPAQHQVPRTPQAQPHPPVQAPQGGPRHEGQAPQGHGRREPQAERR